MAPQSRGGSGGVSRRAALALIGGGGLLGISASGAFDQVGAQRPFELGVDDETALLGIETFSPIEVTSSNSTRDVLELHNRFSETEFTSISVSSNSGLLSMEQPLASGETLGPNQKLTVRGTVSATRSRAEDVNLTIIVSSERERIETTRVVTVDVDLDDRPAGCPVLPNISVTVGSSASGTQRENSDIDLQNEEIDGDVETTWGGGDITIANSTITGDVTAVGDITLTNTEVGGDVRTRDGSNGDISITKSDIGGSVTADGAIEVIQNSTIGGSIETQWGNQGDIVIGNNVTVSGSVIGVGDITTGNSQNNAIGGDVETREGSIGDVDIGNNNTICGSVTSDGSITIGSNSDIGGNIETRQGNNVNIEIGNNATVYGSITGDGNIEIDGTVMGDVTTRTGSGGDVTVNGTVEGGVFADGDVNGNGTIHGNDPRESDDGGGPPWG